MHSVQGWTIQETDVSEEKGRQCLCSPAVCGSVGAGYRAAQSRAWPWIKDNDATVQLPCAVCTLRGNWDTAKRCEKQMHTEFYCGDMNGQNTKKVNLEVKFSCQRHFRKFLLDTSNAAIALWSTSAQSLRQGKCKSSEWTPQVSKRQERNPSQIDDCKSLWNNH